MVEAAHMVQGNLALAPRTRTASAAVRTPLTVCDGGAPAACAPTEQIMRADVHAALAPKAAGSRRSRALCGLAAAIAISLALVSGGVLLQRQAAYDALAASLETTEVIVHAGDSLWTIAAEHAVEGLDTAQTVELIQSWNGLSSATLQPGMELIVPALD